MSDAPETETETETETVVSITLDATEALRGFDVLKRAAIIADVYEKRAARDRAQAALDAAIDRALTAQHRGEVTNRIPVTEVAEGSGIGRQTLHIRKRRLLAVRP